VLAQAMRAHVKEKALGRKAKDVDGRRNTMGPRGSCNG